MTHTINTLKGSYTGTLLQCLEWQAANQGASPDIDGENISDVDIAFDGDPHRHDTDLTPVQAEALIGTRLWWVWHDADASRWSHGEDPDEATRDAERRCAAWVAGESDDGPSGDL